MSCTNLCFKFSKNINVTEIIVKYIAFSPPKHKNYCLENDKSFINKACQKEFKFVYSKYVEGMYPWLKIKAYKIKKRNNNWIAVLHIINQSGKNEKNTILFSHGNCSDLGVMFPTLLDMSTQLNINVVSYDYSGYGESEGSATENVIYDDIEEVADFIIYSLNIPAENILLMGNSLGSAPSLHLAIHKKYSKISGVILLSPIGSGIKLVNPNTLLSKEELSKYDCFCNINKVKEVKCPVFIIHGMKDEIIPHNQSVEIANNVTSKLLKWFPRKGNHNNILSLYRAKFFSKIKLFLEYIKNILEKKINNKCNKYYNGTEITYEINENYLSNQNSEFIPKVIVEEDKAISIMYKYPTSDSNLKAFSINQEINVLYADDGKNPFNIVTDLINTEAGSERLSIVNVQNDNDDELLKIFQKNHPNIYK